jgi:hypothetical protein
MYNSSSSDQRTAYLATFCVVFMGFTSVLLSLVFDWGGVCLDVFGRVLL